MAFIVELRFSALIIIVLCLYRVQLAIEKISFLSCPEVPLKFVWWLRANLGITFGMAKPNNI